MDKSILSVGIDIGTTTTSLIVSRLTYLNTVSSYMVPKVEITNKEVLYKSKLYLTPLMEHSYLDGDAIKEIIEKEYQKAEIRPEQIASGAVIITGESALKENANKILEKLSDYAGEFVVATAGPDLEAIIAGKGSGAQEYSKKHNCVVANLDIGGGTTNIAVFEYGVLVNQTCLDIGGRLLKYRNDESISYVSNRLNDLARKYNFSLLPEQMHVTPSRLQYMTDIMVQVLEEALSCDENRQLAKSMLTSGSRMMVNLPHIDYISFSGGVADCFYGNENAYYKYNDLGVSLAKSIRSSNLTKNYMVIEPIETIRATVVGAGIYTTVVSGSTISYSSELFPIKNIPAFIVGKNAERDAFLGDGRALKEQLNWFLSQNSSDLFICYFEGKKRNSYEELCNLAKTIADAYETYVPAEMPILIITENDMAKSLGQTIARFLKRKQDTVCIDGIKAKQGDYIDLGKPLLGGLAVPVVIKTLILK
jgi:ethanolamine utilization protein EutA